VRIFPRKDLRRCYRLIPKPDFLHSATAFVIACYAGCPTVQDFLLRDYGVGIAC
jgi:hypothetical protein